MSCPYHDHDHDHSNKHHDHFHEEDAFDNKEEFVAARRKATNESRRDIRETTESYEGSIVVLAVDYEDKERPDKATGFTEHIHINGSPGDALHLARRMHHMAKKMVEHAVDAAETEEELFRLLAVTAEIFSSEHKEKESR